MGSLPQEFKNRDISSRFFINSTEQSYNSKARNIAYIFAHCVSERSEYSTKLLNS